MGKNWRQPAMKVIDPDKVKFAHKLVVKVATEIAHELYEQTMMTNSFHASWKTYCEGMTPAQREAAYVKLAMPNLLDDARTTLTDMLKGNLTKSLRDEIADALIKDSHLRGGNPLRPRLVK